MKVSRFSANVGQAINKVNQYAIDKKHIVGSVVMVAKEGQIIYQQASGYADKEQKLTMQVDSQFLLSSVTKPIVSAAALYLAEKGLLKLDSPVTDYLPYFTPKLENGQQPVITLHHLLTHSAGLKYRFCEPHGEGIYNTLQISDGFDQIATDLDENLHRLSKAPLLFAPGTNWCYSLALDVLGGVLTAVTQQPLEEIIKTTITIPLNMSKTGFTIPDNNQLVTHYYNALPEPLPMPSPYFMQLDESSNNGIVSYDPKRIFNPKAYHSGGAGMVGTAPDFMQFLLSLTSINNDLSNNKLMDTMAKCYINSKYGTKGPGWGFGYGGAVLDDPILAQTPQSKGTIQWGGVYGHNWFYDPQQELAVVILTNTAIEGMLGHYPVKIRDAIYHCLA